MEWRRYQEALAESEDHWSTNRYRSLAENAARRLPETQGRCLDAGCGEGLISFALSRHRPKLSLFGTDISCARLAKSSARIPSVRFVAGDLLTLPWKSGAFDAVVCCEVLEHLPDHQSAVEELFRVVKTGGTVLLTVPDRGVLKWSICPQCGSRVYKDGHVRCFTPDDLQQLLEPWGDVLGIVPIGKRWRLFKRRIIAALIPGREFRGRYLLATTQKR